jgi:hypothetical protein
MGSIKLTPFVLFLILLLVLVVAMIFGYKSNMVVEGNTSGSAIWSPSRTDTFAKYSPTAIDAIYESEDGSTKILFDPVTKNIIVPTASGYSQFTRDGKGMVANVNATADATSAPTASAANSVKPAPWSAAIDDLNILYSPLDTATVVIIIKPAIATNEVDQILGIFRSDANGSHTGTLSSSATGITEDTPSPNLYKTPSDETFDKITLDDDEIQVLKMVPGVFWSKTSGICVQTGSAGYDISVDYKTGISKQVSDKNVLVITSMVDDSILANIITRNTIANTPQYQLSSVGFNSDVMNTNITTFFVKSVSPASSPASSSSSDSGSNDSNFENRLLAILSKMESGHTPATSNKCDDPRYMLKTEVIPPVCPACPSCPASSGCNLSINSNGEIVDCNGKKYTPDELYQAAGAPATWAGAAAATANSIGDVAETGLKETGDVLGQTVDAAGNTITKTADAAGNLVTTTVDTAGNIVNRTVGTAADLASELASGIGKGISDAGSGLKDLATDAGTGAKDLVTDAGTGAKDLVTDAGSGAMDLVTDSMRMKLYEDQMKLYQQQQQGYPQQQQGYPQQQQQGYPQQQGQGNYYGYQQPVYSNYQSCNGGGSNYMPITNDFSQFS